MLINASTQRNLAQAKKDAKDEMLLKETMQLADDVALYVREQVELEIETAANNGKFQTRNMILGCRPTKETGFVYDALKCFHVDNFSTLLKWSEALKGLDTVTGNPRWDYVWEMWQGLCSSLLADLDEAGYTVVVERDVEPTPRNLVDKYIRIEW